MESLKTVDGRFAYGRRMQVAFVVKDMDAALELWTDKLKVGPFVVFEHALGTRDFIHRGKRSPVDMALALSYVGDAQIEIICQHNNAPSIYTEAFGRGFIDGGVHHLALWPDDMDAAVRELKTAGFEEVATIRSPTTGDVDVYYFGSPSPLAPMLEIVPLNSARRVYFGKIRSLCEQPQADRRVLRFRDKDYFMRAIAEQEGEGGQGALGTR